MPLDILLIDPLSDEITNTIGDVLEIMEQTMFNFNITVVDPRLQKLTSIPVDKFVGVIILGSFTAYNTKIEWLEELTEFILNLHEHGKIPVLCICMTHELVAHVFGGQVERHKFRRELGAVKLTLTDTGAKSPLFAGFNESFLVYAAHRHDVVEIPNIANVLAYNERGPCQAFQINNLYGVQFHPDIKAETFQSWFATDDNITQLIDEGYISKAEDFKYFIANSFVQIDTNVKLFSNFFEICEKESRTAKLFE